jgi:quinohemoprotein ethanol dehydrogenase
VRRFALARILATVAFARILATVAVAASGCGSRSSSVPEAAPALVTPAEAARAVTSSVDDARLRGAASEPASWLSHGRDPAETRYSPLAGIDEHNVGQLGLAWWLDTETTRGLEATPLVVDGVIYTTGSWSVVFAVDARTGKLLWKHDPEVPREWGGRVCCDVVNRGVAVYRGRVYVGTLDGRLQALDAGTGQVVWSVVTVDQTRPYSITGAPRIVKGKVIIGNGGAEFGVRGYVSAYDTETGALIWRFYTVPGDPAQPFESPELEKAVATWKGGQWWEVGGGGTVWDSMAYDPELDLLYVGTGNGSPWSRHVRSPGGGDNLFLCSILALEPDDGTLVWHYQTTPGDTWDYTSTQHMILADLVIDGRARKVLMQAPKNGFFYVLDRTNGELISAKPYVQVTWAKEVDAKTGRPVVAPGADYREKTAEIRPSTLGGHNWHPMSFNPQTGLVYIPAQEIPIFHALDREWKYRPGAWNTGTDFTVVSEFPRELVSGHLLAWDPVAQREVWRAQYPGPWNGGTLSSAGNLVFQGTARGSFAAYRATDGKLLWEAPAGTGIVAAPVTYEVDGVQYVAVMAGWGGVFALVGGDAASAAGVKNNAGRLLVFKLGGTAELPGFEATAVPVGPIPETPDAKLVARGSDVFHRWCAVCHGFAAVGGGVLADLRRSDPKVYAILPDVVLGGAYRGKGMPSFEKWLGVDDVAALRAYLVSRRNELVREGASAGGS